MNSNKKENKKLLLLVLVFLFANPLLAQDSVDTEIKYSFINYELNNIDIPADSVPFNNFIEKYKTVRDTKEGNLNIVHFGGSHVQADMWTSRIREHFNLAFNDSVLNRGMIFPYRGVKTNGSLQFEVVTEQKWEGFRNVKLTDPEALGLMGWTATAKDSGQFLDVTFLGDSAGNFYFDKLRIFHKTGGFYFPFTVEIGDSIYEPVYIESCKCSEVITDSINNRFILKVHKTDSLQQEFVLTGIQTLLNEPGISYHSVGVNGASVPSYLNCLELEDQLRFINPDLIVFAIGINDSFDSRFTEADFEANYSELIRRIKSTCPDVAFLFITNTDSYRRVRRSFYKNLNGKVVRTSMYRLAKKYDAAVWDLYSVMGGLSSISQWKRSGLAQRDLIHLTKAGYYQAGDLFFDALMKQIETPIIETQP